MSLAPQGAHLPPYGEFLGAVRSCSTGCCRVLEQNLADDFRILLSHPRRGPFPCRRLPTLDLRQGHRGHAGAALIGGVVGHSGGLDRLNPYTRVIDVAHIQRGPGLGRTKPPIPGHRFVRKQIEPDVSGSSSSYSPSMMMLLRRAAPGDQRHTMSLSGRADTSLRSTDYMVHLRFGRMRSDLAWIVSPVHCGFERTPRGVWRRGSHPGQG